MIVKIRNILPISCLLAVSLFVVGCSQDSKVQEQTRSFNNSSSGLHAGSLSENNKEIHNREIDSNKGYSMKNIKSNTDLEYKIIQEGTGDSPEKGDIVVVHYTGWLNDNNEPGRKFDSSVDRGEPFNFIIGVGQVIRGWDEGVASMKIGEKRRLFIPSELGYGKHGAGSIIPPNSNLIFDVELLNINKSK